MSFLGDIRNAVFAVCLVTALLVKGHASQNIRSQNDPDQIEKKSEDDADVSTMSKTAIASNALVTPQKRSPSEARNGLSEEEDINRDKRRGKARRHQVDEDERELDALIKRYDTSVDQATSVASPEHDYIGAVRRKKKKKRKSIEPNKSEGGTSEYSGDENVMATKQDGGIDPNFEDDEALRKKRSIGEESEVVESQPDPSHEQVKKNEATGLVKDTERDDAFERSKRSSESSPMVDFDKMISNLVPALGAYQYPLPNMDEPSMGTMQFAGSDSPKTSESTDTVRVKKSKPNPMAAMMKMMMFQNMMSSMKGKQNAPLTYIKQSPRNRHRRKRGNRAPAQQIQNQPSNNVNPFQQMLTMRMLMNNLK